MRTPTQQMALLLGSNIQPERNLPRAIELLKKRFQIENASSVWETTAIGSSGPNFLNAAVLLEHNLSPRAMKEFVLRPMEASLGRVRTHDKNAARTIDLDVVTWGARTWDDDIWKYAHAAVPVAELTPDLRYDPFQDPLAQVARKLQQESEIDIRLDTTHQVHSLVGAMHTKKITQSSSAREFVQSVG
jgi:2-amino-4-hydroxy-6-hydroxymethyldihydropteridine diphosphokinase